MFTPTHSFALRPGEARGLEVRERSNRDTAQTVAVRFCGEALGEHVLALDGAPAVLPVDGGTLELSLVHVFLKPHLRVRFDGVDLPGSQFHLATHQRAALQRGLAAVGATLLATLAAGWNHVRDYSFGFGAATLGVLALLPWIRRGSRVAVFLAMALVLSVAGASLALIEKTEFDGIIMLTALAAYDLLYVLGDRQWMDEVGRRSTPR